MAELSCQQLVELVTDYLEGGLSPVDRERFDEHIAVCPRCRAHLRQMRDTLRLLGTLPEETLSVTATDDLLRAFREWAR
jgi:anti-sigma factor RsiW